MTAMPQDRRTLQILLAHAQTEAEILRTEERNRRLRKRHQDADARARRIARRALEANEAAAEIASLEHTVTPDPEWRQHRRVLLDALVGFDGRCKR